MDEATGPSDDEARRADPIALLRRRAEVREARRAATGEALEAARRADRAMRDQLRVLLAPDRLRLRTITADDPPEVLDQIVRHEQVHRIRDRADLDRRLASDRRCFGLVHEAAADELLVFVEVALTRGLAGDMGPLLHSAVDPSAEHSADTAIFYSINSCQPGAAGLALGGDLLERVLRSLGEALPSLTLYSTLSPMPRFRTWLLSRLDHPPAPPAHHDPPPLEPSELASGRWFDQPDVAGRVRPWLEGVAARYLTEAPSGKVADPVGNFHLGNGARVERVCWLADRSPEGIERSWGVMVNYRYDPDRLAERAERYAAGQVARSPEVERLAG